METWMVSVLILMATNVGTLVLLRSKQHSNDAKIKEVQTDVRELRAQANTFSPRKDLKDDFVGSGVYKAEYNSLKTELHAITKLVGEIDAKLDNLLMGGRK